LGNGPIEVVLFYKKVILFICLENSIYQLKIEKQDAFTNANSLL